MIYKLYPTAQVIHRIGGLEIQAPPVKRCTLVIHRIGGLEICRVCEDSTSSVIHRIGGLEKVKQRYIILVSVIHRIGGLETNIVTFKGTDGCYTPHRWLRNLFRQF